MSMVHLRAAACTPPSDAAAQRGGDRLRGWPAPCSAPTHPVPWEALRGRLRPDPRRASPRWSPAAPTTTAGRASPTDSSSRTRRATHANSPPPPARPTSPSIRWSGCRCRRAGWCCRPCAATTSTTPRSTGSTTDTAASRAAVAWSFVNPADIETLGLTDGERVDLVSEWTDADRR